MIARIAGGDEPSLGVEPEDVVERGRGIVGRPHHGIQVGISSHAGSASRAREPQQQSVRTTVRRGNRRGASGRGRWLLAVAGTSRQRERQREERAHGRKDNCRAVDEQYELQKLGQSDQVQTPFRPDWSTGTA
jgi:hypothetical protein